MKIKFSQEQRGELIKNSNVIKCSEKAITYNKNFKVSAVKQYLEDGKMANEIFRNAGFDLDIIGKDIPKHCLRDWNGVFKTKGLDGLKIESRGRGGGRPKTKEVTEKERIKYLEAEVAYLKAENDFLTKLRAKRRE